MKLWSIYLINVDKKLCIINILILIVIISYSGLEYDNNILINTYPLGFIQLSKSIYKKGNVNTAPKEKACSNWSL